MMNEYEPGKPMTVPRHPQYPPPRARLDVPVGTVPVALQVQAVREPDMRRPNEPQNPPRSKTATGGVTLREAPPRRSKFPSVMSQLDEIEQNQNKEEDLAAKSRAAQVLREVEEEHERKEIDQKPEEEERVDPAQAASGLREVGPGVFLDNETESKAKGRMVDETLGEEAVSDRYTSEIKRSP